MGRLMALAVYDSADLKRVYKPAFDHETARNIIVEGRGTQFDPLVVEAFLFEEDAFRSLIVTYPDDENPCSSQRLIRSFHRHTAVELLQCVPALQPLRCGQRH